MLQLYLLVLLVARQEVDDGVDGEGVQVAHEGSEDGIPLRLNLQLVGSEGGVASVGRLAPGQLHRPCSDPGVVGLAGSVRVRWGRTVREGHKE